MKCSEPVKKMTRTSGEFDDVGGLLAFGSLHNVEFDAVAFTKSLEFVADDGRVVNENVRTIVAPYKTESFGVIEPLHRAVHGHCLSGCPILFTLTKEGSARFELWARRVGFFASFR